MESSSSPRKTSAILVTFFTALAFTFLAQDAAQGGIVAQRLSFLHHDHDAGLVVAENSSSGSGEMPVVVSSETEALSNQEDDDAIVVALRQKLEPKKLLLNPQGELSRHQFLHLHHMKTGGKSACFFTFGFSFLLFHSFTI